MTTRPTADKFFESAEQWRPELLELRSIVRRAGLEETVKWGGPVYTHRGKNVVGIGGFKSYFGLWFFQGALLADPAQRLTNAQEGKTRALRQMRFTAREEIDPKTIDAYLREAIELVEQGREIRPRRRGPLEIPAELRRALRRDAQARSGFATLTPGRQREFVEYLESAKRDATRQRRLARILPLLAAGRGLNDRYRR